MKKAISFVKNLKGRSLKISTTESDNFIFDKGCY